ncbi:MAG: DUF4339 domain-containing protein [Hydrogenophaga sp.]|nr:DUF4339 domain-containing protein [Hydrogenophaga sp.]
MSEWHYEKDAQRLGAVPEKRLAELIRDRSINGSTLVWKQGFATWTPLAKTALATYLVSPDAPPPLPGNRIGNQVVWVLAVAPLIGLMSEAFIAGATASHDGAVDAAVASALQNGTYWYVSLALNIGLSLWDARRLRNAGVDTSGFGNIAFIVPVYLWKRAKALGQGPAYFWGWIGSFVLAMLMALGAGEEVAQGSAPDAQTQVTLDEAQRRMGEPVNVAALQSAPQRDGQAVVETVTVDSNRFASVGGLVQVTAAQPDGDGPKQLIFNGVAVSGLANDFVDIRRAFRYGERDVVLVTLGCSGSSCSYTQFVLLDTPAQGETKLVSDQRFVIDMDGEVPEVSVQADGSLLIAYVARNGPQRFVYAKGQLSPV